MPLSSTARRKKQQGKPDADHAGFLQELQAQLLQTTASDFEESYSPGSMTPTQYTTAIATDHKLSEFPEWVQVREGFRKRPQHQCKVYSIGKTKVGQRSATSTMTCHQIWHVKWKHGEERPRPRVGRDIQMRGLGKKRRRRATSAETDEAKGEEAAAGEEKEEEEEEEEEQEANEGEQEGANEQTL
ncbi:unnamed protein product [Phytophthora fragariaefolia]|uniref:Unnamed protein product n=1 Tax=Phytophthora fragariaefolia TaxID=1490495 RepID=A0A9W7CWR4_9STRA|nr:unnamed protein product [Phytophthora fragariaefolia]